jgi:hypothetical protein
MAGSRLQRRSPSGLRYTDSRRKNNLCKNEIASKKFFSSSSRASSNTSLNRLSEESDNIVIRQSSSHLSVPSSQASLNGTHVKAKDPNIEGVRLVKKFIF